MNQKLFSTPVLFKLVSIYFQHSYFIFFLGTNRAIHMYWAVTRFQLTSHLTSATTLRGMYYSVPVLLGKPFNAETITNNIKILSLNYKKQSLTLLSMDSLFLDHTASKTDSTPRLTHLWCFLA